MQYSMQYIFTRIYILILYLNEQKIEEIKEEEEEDRENKLIQK
jgi:hypothetical protein